MAISIHGGTPGKGETRGTRTLTELRAKTDRDLARVVERAVEMGLWLARESAFDEAEAIYQGIAPLLPLLERSPGPEAQPVRRQAAELRTELDQAIVAGTGVLT